MTAASRSTTSFCHYPRVCSVCGRPARITTESLDFRTIVGEPPTTTHIACKAAK